MRAQLPPTERVLGYLFNAAVVLVIIAALVAAGFEVYIAFNRPPGGPPKQEQSHGHEPATGRRLLRDRHD